MFGTLIGYVILFRFIQYFLFAYQTGSFNFFSSASTNDNKKQYQAVATQENKQQQEQQQEQQESGLEIEAGNNSNL